MEDDFNFGSVQKAYLEMNDYIVTWIKDGKLAFERYKADNYNICILDIMLPYKDGFTIAREIRGLSPDVPLVFLTAKTLKEDIIAGFKIGADDYITKPFDSEILLHKIRAILNRDLHKIKKDEDKNDFEIGQYLFDYRLRTLVYKDIVKKLSPKEAELLKLLCLSRETVLSRGEALNKIWRENNYFTSRSMDVFITKLRKYLKEDPSIEIVNIHGSGFRLLTR